MMARRQRVLFLCTGNSCRSQMAEALLRHLAGERCEALSAGTHPAGFVHPLAIEVMREIGIDMAGQRSKSVAEYLPPDGTLPDVVISVCDTAARNCPVFPAKVERRHWPFDDPAAAEGTDEERWARFGQVRDEIRAAVQAFCQQPTVHRSSGLW